MRFLLVVVAAVLVAPLSWADRFQEAADWYAQQPARAFSAEIQPKMPEGSPMQGFEMPAIHYRVAAKGPAEISLRAPQGAMEASFHQANGGQLILLPFARSYVLLDQAQSIDTLIAEDQEMTVPGGSLLVGLAFADKSPLWKATATMVGEVELEGVKTVHYQLEGSAGGEIWIATEGDPVIVGYLEPPIDSPEIENDEEGVFMFQPRLEMRFSDWGIATDDDFNVEPPIGFEKMASVQAAMERLQGGIGAGPEAEHPGRDEPAPDVTLHPMGGEPKTLASLKGHVVVLDFWATWCKPCVIDLPAVIETVGAFPEDKIVFYAVNRFESEETIQAFIDEEQLTLPVALDPENKIAGAFQVSAIPHLVVIDAEGIVRYINVGMALGGGKSELRNKLEQLIGTAE